MGAASIPKDYKNTSKLKHCLTVANFAGDPGDPGDTAVLKKEKDKDALRVAASNVRPSVSKKMLEWEGVPKRGDRDKRTLTTGLAK